MNFFKYFFFVITLWNFTLTSAYAGIFKPESYDECITKCMKGVSSDVAAKAIIKSCREQFPEDKKKHPPSIKLSVEQLKKLVGTGSVDFQYERFDGKLYNGNTDVVISEISIAIKKTKDFSEVEKQPFESEIEDNWIFYKNIKTGEIRKVYPDGSSKIVREGRPSVTIEKPLWIAKEGEKYQKNEGEVQRIYSCDTDIAPLKTGTLGFSILVGEEVVDYSWVIIEAKGYKSE